MRLFIAVQVPDELKGKLGTLSKEIEQEGIRPVKPEKMHITLRFIGEYPEDKVGRIEEMLVSVRFKAFDCSLKGVGAFPNEDYIRVVWAGIESGGALEELAGQVNAALPGVPGDGKFSAHLTIARVKRKVDLKAFLDKHREDGLGAFRVSGFELVKSVLQPGGPEYTTLAEFKAEEDA